MAILDVIQQHIDNKVDVLADEAAKAAGLFVVACMSCRRIKSADPAPTTGLSHGLHEGACVAAYRAQFGGRAA